jgi:hypothetical protein
MKWLTFGFAASTPPFPEFLAIARSLGLQVEESPTSFRVGSDDPMLFYRLGQDSKHLFVEGGPTVMPQALGRACHCRGFEEVT